MVESVDISQQRLANQTSVILSHVDATIAHIDATAARADSAIADEQKHIHTLEKAAIIDQKEALETLMALKHFVANTDDSLNSDKYGMIPVTTLAIARTGNDAHTLAEESSILLQHSDRLVTSPQVKSVLDHAESTAANVDEATQHVNSVADAVDKAMHPPKRSRAQRFLQWFIGTVFGNAVQGAVRR